MLIRLSRFLSNSGITSRRKSELLILEGKITVNDTVIKKLGTKIDTDIDVVKFQGKVVTLPDKVYLALNKPPGYLSTVRDDFGRQIVTDLLKDLKCGTRLFPVGRLDLNSRGLILLTNDGDFALKITHPGFKIAKTYELELSKELTIEDINKIKTGIRLDGQKVNVIKLEAFSRINNKKIKVTIHEGRKRILRRLFLFLGYKVIDLKRVKIGNYALGSLPEGRYRILDKKDINNIFKIS